jgi:hypothetical protein
MRTDEEVQGANRRGHLLWVPLLQTFREDQSSDELASEEDWGCAEREDAHQMGPPIHEAFPSQCSKTNVKLNEVANDRVHH